MCLQMRKPNTETGLTHATGDLQSSRGTSLISNGGEIEQGSCCTSSFFLFAFKHSMNKDDHTILEQEIARVLR